MFKRQTPQSGMPCVRVVFSLVKERWPSLSTATSGQSPSQHGISRKRSDARAMPRNSPM